MAAVRAMAQPPAQQPGFSRGFSRRNPAGRGNFPGERVPPKAPTTRPAELHEAGQWSASIVNDFPCNTNDCLDVWKKLQKEALDDGVKLSIRARKSSFGEPKLTVRGVAPDCDMDRLRRRVAPRR